MGGSGRELVRGEGTAGRGEGEQNKATRDVGVESNEVCPLEFNLFTADHVCLFVA